MKGTSLLAALCLVQLAMAQEPNAAPQAVKRHDATAALQQRQPLPEVIVQFANPVAASATTQALRLQKLSAFASDPSTWVLSTGRANVEQTLIALRKTPGVVSAQQNFRLFWAKDFVPNDPYFNPNFPTAGWPGQWTLNDTTPADLDINVLPAWLLTTGTSIVVGIVDDGFETIHPDLSSNYQSSSSFNFGNNTTNPNPLTAEDNHGTALAGIIAARGGNNSGITGVAATGRWSGLRVNFDNLTTAQLVDATRHLSIGASPVLRIKNHSYGPISPFEDGSLEVAALAESGATGTIHVRSAGNLRDTLSEDVNKAAVRNSIHSITVAAIDSRGRFADYSSFGASIFVCAPSGAIASGTRPILTTDRFSGDAGFNRNGTTDLDQLVDGAYTSLFGTDFDGGTSVAAGLVSGTMALARAVNPNLDTRFAKHLLARTSRQIDASDTSASGDTWRTNGAGFKFNQNYGFGLLDAGALVEQAGQWFGPNALTTTTIPTTAVGVSIPDNNATGVSRTFVVTETTPLEEVQVTLSINHVYRGDIEAFLTSPSGTKTRLVSKSLFDDGDNINWTFSANTFWGEAPNGTWTLQVRDQGATDTGTWNNYGVTLRSGNLVRRITGAITFGDLADPGAQIPVALEIRDAVTDALLETKNITAVEGQTFSVETSLSGAVKVFVVTPNWLRKRVDATLNQGTTALGTIALTNGDPDQSVEVDAADIDLVIANFGNSGSGAVPGDLDWSTEVDAADIDIAIANFGATGD